MFPWRPVFPTPLSEENTSDSATLIFLPLLITVALQNDGVADAGFEIVYFELDGQDAISFVGRGKGGVARRMVGQSGKGARMDEAVLLEMLGANFGSWRPFPRTPACQHEDRKRRGSPGDNLFSTLRFFRFPCSSFLGRCFQTGRGASGVRSHVERGNDGAIVQR